MTSLLSSVDDPIHYDIHEQSNDFYSKCVSRDNPPSIGINLEVEG